MKTIAVNWEGDLEDDCTLRVGDFVARAECMGEQDVSEDSGEASTWSYWWCSVTRGDEVLFDESEPGGTIVGGDMARAVCEAIIRAAGGL